MTNQDTILISLRDGYRIVRGVGANMYSWKFKDKKPPYKVSLKNSDTSALFRRGLLTAKDGEMLLSETGILIANKLEH